jgi:hypothetical protein
MPALFSFLFLFAEIGLQSEIIISMWKVANKRPTSSIAISDAIKI